MVRRLEWCVYAYTAALFLPQGYAQSSGLAFTKHLVQIIPIGQQSEQDLQLASLAPKAFGLKVLDIQQVLAQNAAAVTTKTWQVYRLQVMYAVLAYLSSQ